MTFEPALMIASVQTVYATAMLTYALTFPDKNAMRAPLIWTSLVLLTSGLVGLSTFIWS